MPFPLLVHLIETYGKSPVPDVLAFGDSVMERISRHDSDRRTLGEMLQDIVPDHWLDVVTRSALNPSLTRGLVEVVRRLTPPAGMLLPVNLRCFSPQWHLNPAWGFHQEHGIIGAWLADPEAPISPVSDVVDAGGLYGEFERTRVAYELSELDTIGAFRQVTAGIPRTPEERLARTREIFVYHYGHAMVPDHPRLADLVATVDTALGVGIRPFVYLTPINVEAAERAAGARLVEIIGSNASLVRRALGPRVEVADWSQAVSDRHFFHEDIASEHLNEAGRKLVATRIGELVGRVLP